MAKKRANRKPSGTDTGGEPLDLSNRGEYMDQVDRMVDSMNSARKAEQRNQSASARTYRRDARVALRNVTDFQRNAPTPRAWGDVRGVAGKKGPFAVGQTKSAMEKIQMTVQQVGPKTTASPTPGRGPKKDTLSGLTHEGGTKSLLKGMLKFLK